MTMNTAPNTKPMSSSPTAVEGSGELTLDSALDEVLKKEPQNSDEPSDDANPNPEDQADDAVDGNEEEETVDENETSDEDPDSADDEEEQADGESDEDDTKTHSLLVDGQEHKVTSKELKALAQQGMDYTNKTKALAEERKVIQATQSEWKSKGDAVVQEYQVLEVGLMNPKHTQEQIDELMKTNPQAATQLKHEEEKRLQSLKYVRDRISAIKAEQQKVQDAQVLEQKKTAYLELVKQFPEFAFNATDKKPSEAASRLNSYLVGQDFSQEDIDAVADHRHFIIAEKARRYDELMKAKKPAPKKPLPKVTKKTAVKAPPPKKSAMEKLGRTGSIDDGVDVLLNDMRKKS